MDFFQAIVLGIVEGASEFLPVSSTAHLILAAKWLGVSQTEFAKSFEVIIQLGAILAVLLLYGKQFLNQEVLKKIFWSFIPTGILGLVFYGLIKNYLMESLGIILGALFFGGVLIIIFEKINLRRKKFQVGLGKISYRQCFLIGLFQSFSMIPGVSRAAATILGGLALGIEKKTIVEFSFLLAVPTMLVATAYDIFRNASSFSLSDWKFLAVGFVVSFLTAIVGIKFLMAYISKKSFSFFGIYRIILAAVFYWLFFLG